MNEFSSVSILSLKKPVSMSFVYSEELFLYDMLGVCEKMSSVERRKQASTILLTSDDEYAEVSSKSPSLPMKDVRIAVTLSFAAVLTIPEVIAVFMEAM